MRSQRLWTFLEVAGLAAMSAGAFTVSITVGLFVTGAAMFAVGFANEV